MNNIGIDQAGLMDWLSQEKERFSKEIEWKALSILMPEIFRVISRDLITFAMASIEAETNMQAMKMLPSSEEECMQMMASGEIGFGHKKQCTVIFKHWDAIPDSPQKTALQALKLPFWVEVDVNLFLGKDRPDMDMLSFHFVDLKGAMPFLICESQTIQIPYDLMFTKPQRDHDYVVYVHTITNDVDDETATQISTQLRSIDDKDTKTLLQAKPYIGITKQGPIKRLKQHIDAARTLRNAYLFQHYLRDTFITSNAPKRLHTSLMGCHLTFVEAMELEEQMVDRFSLHPMGLNMIPGGFEGLRYIRKHHKASDPKLFAELRDAFIEKIPKGNPLLSAQWGDPDYAARILCGWGNRLDVQLVREIQYYREIDKSWQWVSQRIGRDDPQVKNVFLGKTYERVAV